MSTETWASVQAGLGKAGLAKAEAQYHFQPMVAASSYVRGERGRSIGHWQQDLVTFSWLKASIRFMAVSRAVTMRRKSWSCSHSGLDSRSRDIFTADLDMAVKKLKAL